MSEEKMKILQMIEEQLISVEEGLKLLESLKVESTSENVLIIDEKQEQEVKKVNLGKEDINEEYALSCNGKDEIRVELNASDITIITEARDDLYITVDGYELNDADNEYFDISEIDNTIVIKESFNYEKTKNSFFGLFNVTKGCHVMLHLPESYKKDLSVKTVSGDIDVVRLDLESFEFSSVSGDLDANEVYTQNSVFKTTSGDVEISDFKGELLFSTVAGDVEVCFNGLTADVNGKTVSGDVQLSLPATSEFGLALRTLSGELDCDFPITMLGGNTKFKIRGKVVSDDIHINIATTSGDLEIFKSKLSKIKVNINY